MTIILNYDIVVCLEEQCFIYRDYFFAQAFFASLQEANGLHLRCFLRQPLQATLEQLQGEKLHLGGYFGSNPDLPPFFIGGKITVSLTDLSARTANNLSESPKPAAGGMPYSIAST